MLVEERLLARRQEAAQPGPRFASSKQPPATLDGVLGHITALGWRLDAEAAADELTNGMRLRLERVRAALAEKETYPRVYVSEWLEPPYAAGHWVPDMVSAAGGMEVAGIAGEPSFRMRWTDVAGLEPDTVVLAPCGFDLDRIRSAVVDEEHGDGDSKQASD